jgi:hypothetical protein
MSKSPLTPEQWAEARRLRAEGATFAAIGRQLGVSPSTVVNRARNEGWPPRFGSVPRAAPRPKLGPLPAETAGARRGLMRRIYAIMDISLEMQELRMQKQLKVSRKIARSGDDAVPPGVSDADLAQFANTLRAIEQGKELDPDLHRSTDGGARSAGVQADPAASEADALRRDIAERLARLVPSS